MLRAAFDSDLAVNFSPLNRRTFLRTGFLSAAALVLPPETARAAGRGRAKSCIQVFLTGGPAHQETFDPKSEAPAEVRGAFVAIPTNVPGVRVSEVLPLLARQADKYCLVRSCTHDDHGHGSAQYAGLTGRMHPLKNQNPPSTADDFPPPGAVVSKLRPLGWVPNWVALPVVPRLAGVPVPGHGAGFLGAACEPLTIQDDPQRPEFELATMNLAGDGLERLEGRRRLRKVLGGSGLPLEAPPQRAMDALHERAFTLLSSERTRRAFSLDREPPALRDRYGRHSWGQSLLLARRLVEAGTPLVTVYLSQSTGEAAWDTHNSHFAFMRQTLAPPFDRGLAALLADLDDRGMLDETLVVVNGEFGRTPKVNSGGGRDHWPGVYSTLLAGGGVGGGQVFGASDRSGAYPSANPVSPGDLAATIYDCLGFDPGQEITDRLGRPYALATGRAIEAILG